MSLAGWFLFIHAWILGRIEWITHLNYISLRRFFLFPILFYSDTSTIDCKVYAFEKNFSVPFFFGKNCRCSTGHNDKWKSVERMPSPPVFCCLFCLYFFSMGLWVCLPVASIASWLEAFLKAWRKMMTLMLAEWWRWAADSDDDYDPETQTGIIHSWHVSDIRSRSRFTIHRVNNNRHTHPHNLPISPVCLFERIKYFRIKSFLPPYSLSNYHFCSG